MHGWSVRFREHLLIKINDDCFQPHVRRHRRDRSVATTKVGETARSMLDDPPREARVDVFHDQVALVDPPPCSHPRFVRMHVAVELRGRAGHHGISCYYTWMTLPVAILRRCGPCHRRRCTCFTPPGGTSNGPLTCDDAASIVRPSPRSN